MTATMSCEDVRPLLLAYQKGRLEPGLESTVGAHLDGCPGCAHAEVVEQELTQLLERRLPQYPASLALKRRLAARWPAAAPAPAPRVAPRERRWLRAWVPALAIALALLALVPLYYRTSGSGGPGAMVTEAVNDYVRLVQSERPLEVESGGIHQVLPWFSGRLDFAPAVRFAGDADFPLRGGAVGYFLDRKAAVIVYGRRLHTIPLFVFRADGLPWPSRGLQPTGQIRSYRAASRGFNVLLWRNGELGYALVSDVEPRDLAELAARISSGP